MACVAWSGDVVQLQYDRPDIQFVIPEEGGMSWYDTMVIPKGSPNAYAAADWMNFVYDPVQAAQLTAYVQYVSPVKGVQEELDQDGRRRRRPRRQPDPVPRRRGRRPAEDVRRRCPHELDAAYSDRFLEITGG